MNHTQAKSAVAAIGVVGLTAAVIGMKNWTSSAQPQREGAPHGNDTSASATAAGVIAVDSATAARLLQPAAHIKEPTHYRNETERKELVARWKKLAALWMERDKRDVTSDIAPFLEDRDSSVRAKAAQMLGRLDTDEAAQVLEAKWQKQETDKERRRQEKAEQRARERQNGTIRMEEVEAPNTDVSELTLRLALGRANGRKLRGKAKIEAISQSVGLSLDQVEEFTVKIKDPEQAKQWRDSRIADVANEIVDTLYRMRKRGERIDGLAPQRFSAGPALDVKLSGAGLPLAEEIKAAVDYAVRPDSGSYVERYLLELGPEATEALIERLQEIEQSPQKDRGDWNCASMFRAAAMTEDPRVVPLLQKFSQSKDPTVSSYATNTLADIRQDRIVPRLPA